MSQPMHPICAQRQRRLRFITVLLTFDVACVIVANAAGLTLWMTVAAAAALVTMPGWVRFAYLLHFRCPSRRVEVGEE
jgi:hypothetical protein